MPDANDLDHLGMWGEFINNPKRGMNDFAILGIVQFWNYPAGFGVIMQNSDVMVNGHAKPLGGFWPVLGYIADQIF